MDGLLQERTALAARFDWILPDGPPCPVKNVDGRVGDRTNVLSFKN
jgi:hypothetical protein